MTPICRRRSVKSSQIEFSRKACVRLLDREWLVPTMTARIFKPAKNAMQSGAATSREWQLDFEREQAQVIEPLMGWTSSGDMKQQLTMRFDTEAEAIAYCERHGIPYQVLEPKIPARRIAAYADNFAFKRREPWTH
jgi:hypothetical protein